MYQDPPLFHHLSLIKSAFKHLFRNRPKGAMSQYLGKRYTVRELYEEEDYEAKDLFKLGAVRAFETTPLIGATFKVQSDTEIGKALHVLLTEKMPGILWDLKEDWTGPFRKYQIIHGSITAPPDEATSEPMAIELFGRLIEIDNEKSSSWANKRWDNMQKMINRLMEEEGISALDKPDSFDRMYPPIAGDMVIKIEQATYANIIYPGIGIPLYF